MIIYDPRLPADKAGRVLPQFALNVDLPTTFLDLAGVDKPKTIPGQLARSVSRWRYPDRLAN